MSEPNGPDWLTAAVGYEVYIRSFADGTGNGVGDLMGLHDRLDHLAWLGVDIVWITPFYPSPMADHGYDVADYLGVDPLFGDLEQFDRVVHRAHELDLRVVIDIVPNHSSNKHPWFTEALANPTGPYRDYYLWRDPAPDGGPPNNWISHFGGPAWSLDETSGQYYCHLFLPEQPDLNWRNPDVRTEFAAILEFWFERGVDGLRIDVAHALVKDEQFRGNPQQAQIDHLIDPRDVFHCFEHLHDILQPETLGIYREWREIADRHEAALIGETYVLEATQLADLLPGDGLNLGFWFAPMKVNWDADSIRNTLREPNIHCGPRVAWVQSSHDESRPVARFGGGDLGRRRSLGLSVLMLGLPGVPFLYQGQELGLDDADVPAELRSDPVATRNDGAVGRDVCRTPIPWEPGPNLGFSTAASTWLPVAHGESDSVAAQRSNPSAHLHQMKALLDLRKRLPDLSNNVEWLDTPHDIVAFQRDNHVFALNTGDETITWEMGGSWTILHRTSGETNADHTTLSLSEGEALVARAD